MDPEDQKPKITLANFFESIKDTNVIAKRALKMSSGFSKAIKESSDLIEVNKSDIQELQKTVATISKDVTNIQDYIEDQQERRSRELDKREDEVFEKEDKLQKEFKGEGGAKGAGGATSTADALGKGAGAFISGGLGFGLMGLNALNSPRSAGQIFGGTVDLITDDLTDFDRMGDDEKQGRPSTYGRVLGGFADAILGGAFPGLDLDKQGGFFSTREQFLENKEKRKKAGKKGLMRLLPFNDGGKVFDNDGNSSNNNVDSVLAMLTPGEFVMKKEAVDRLGEGFLTSLNENEIKKENPVVKSLKNFFSGDNKNKSDMPFELTGDSKRLIGNDKPFLKEVIRISRKYEIDPGDLLGLMASESSLNPASDNGTHVGLIQFSADRAKELGTTQEKLVKMNRAQQMKFVEKYFEIVNLPKGASKGELYTSVIMPAYTDKGGDFELMTKFDKFSDGELGNPSVYADNKGLDANSDGFITIDEMGSRVDKKRKEFGIKPVEQSKPEGLKRVLAGVADAVTGNKFDFDQRGVNPDMSDSNKDLSVNIAQNPSEGGSDNSVEILDTITQNMGGSSGDGTGSTIQPQFDLADTSSPAVMNPESPSEFIALLTDTSNSAFR